jgi:Queuine tRNA-ribosyltransferase
MAEPLATRRGALPVPSFLPDATRAGVRGTTSDDLRAVGVEALVVNAFHLLRRPGARVVQAGGGIHRFMDWSGPVLSDSGGFQVWSLIRQDPARGVIRDREVIFREPATGEKWNLTPERVVQLQFQLGSDIAVCLDDCTDAEAPLDEQERSVARTVAWARRSREAFDRLAADRNFSAEERPRIFAVVQGGGSEDLRRRCAAELAEIGFDGYGFGGWPFAADGSLLTDALAWVVDALPASGSAGPTTWSRRSSSAIRCSTARYRRATHGMHASMPSVRAIRSAAFAQALRSSAPCICSTRNTGSITARSRRDATARRAHAIAGRTCTISSRSGTHRPSAWPRSTTCGSTSGWWPPSAASRQARAAAA